MQKKLRNLMDNKELRIRDVAVATGLSTALVCYIVQGIAWFPTYEHLKLACDLLKCEPTDIYTKTELHRYYPEVVKSVKKPSAENPRVRIPKEMAEIITQNYDTDLTSYVKKAVNRQIRLDLMREEGHYL